MKILDHDVRSLPAALLAVFAGAALAAGGAWALTGPPRDPSGSSSSVCHGHGRIHGVGPGGTQEGFGRGHGRGGRFGPGMGGPDAPLAMLDSMAGDLALDGAQWEQIHEIMGEARENIEPLRALEREKHEALRQVMHAETVDEAAIRSGAGEIAGIRADMMIAGAKTRLKVMALLTPEQKTYMESERARNDQMMMERHQNRREHRRGSRGGRDAGAI
jgi:Spy/CpxP family protein refolding chaperone